MDDGRFDDADEGLAPQVDSLKIDTKSKPTVIHSIVFGDTKDNFH